MQTGALRAKSLKKKPLVMKPLKMLWMSMYWYRLMSLPTIHAAKAISKKYGIFGPPAILFFDEKGQQIKDATIIGFKEPKEFLNHLGAIK